MSVATERKSKKKCRPFGRRTTACSDWETLVPYKEKMYCGDSSFVGHGPTSDYTHTLQSVPVGEEPDSTTKPASRD